MRTGRLTNSLVWVPGAQKATPGGRISISQEALVGLASGDSPTFPEASTSGWLLSPPPASEDPQSAGPRPGNSNKVVPSPGVSSLSLGARTPLGFPRHNSPPHGHPHPKTLHPLRHSLVQDKVEIKGASAAGLLLGADQPPGTAERQQPQPRDQPAPRTARQGPPRHHRAAGGGLGSSSSRPLGGAPRDAAADRSHPGPRGGRTRSCEGAWSSGTHSREEGGRRGGREVRRGQREALQPQPQLLPESRPVPAESTQSFPSGSGEFLQTIRAQATARGRSSSPASTPASRPASGSLLGPDPESHSSRWPGAPRLPCAAGRRPPGRLHKLRAEVRVLWFLPLLRRPRLPRAPQTFFPELGRGGWTVPFRGGG